MYKWDQHGMQNSSGSHCGSWGKAPAAVRKQKNWLLLENLLFLGLLLACLTSIHLLLTLCGRGPNLLHIIERTR